MLGWVAVVVACWALARVFLGYPRCDGSWESLSRREVATVTAVADAFFPQGGAIRWSGSDAGIERYIDRFLAASQPSTRLLMRLLLFLVEHATLFFPAPGGLRGLRRFSSLEPARRAAVLDGWQRSRFHPRRLVFASLRALITLGYFAHPPVLRQLRLAPYAIDTPVCQADLWYPRIGAHPDTIPYGPDDLTPPSTGAPLDLGGRLMEGYGEEGG